MGLKVLRASVVTVLIVMFVHLVATVRGADDPPRSDQRQGNQVLPLDDLLASLDTDRDGRISKEEAVGVYARRFSRWDADGDVYVTRQELHDYRRRFGIEDDGTRTAGAGRGGQRRATPTAVILREPADWRLETMPIPPGFAPDIEMRGSEEIRFAPGMFDTSSGNYFTCVMAVLLDNEPKVGSVELKEFLEKYYRGLSTSVGRRKGFSPSIEEMQAEVNPVQSDSVTTNCFAGQVVFFDSFSDGRRIRLNVEAKVIPLAATKQTCVILLVSPSDDEESVWRTLREIGKKAETNVPGERTGLRM